MKEKGKEAFKAVILQVLYPHCSRGQKPGWSVKKGVSWPIWAALPRSDALDGQSMNPCSSGTRWGGSRHAVRAVGHITGQGKCHSRVEAGRWPSHLSRSVHLFFRMRPVEAQEEVGVPAVQEKVCCSEGNREALNIVAEVGGDPEVWDEGVHEDILGRKGHKEEGKQAVSLQEVRAELRLPARKTHIPGEPLGGQTLEERNLPASAAPSPATLQCS